MATVDINNIKISSGRRALNQGKVVELVESIRANGLLHPITIDQNFNLVAGLHRLTACKLLNFERVECNIIDGADVNRARLVEIDENLIRSELDSLERAELWLERDRILDHMGLRAQSGDNQYQRRSGTVSKKVGKKQGSGGEIISPPPIKTTLELAKQVGYTDRTFQQGKQIAKNLVPDIKATIQGTPIAKSTTALLKVARAGSEERKQAEQAEQAAQAAQAKHQLAESDRQLKRAAEARAKQRDLQLVALNGVLAAKEAKQVAKKKSPNPQSQASDPLKPSSAISVSWGDEWNLDHHVLYCGNTTDAAFYNYLPSNAALAIVLPSSTWEHNYLANEARVVAVLRTEGQIHHFCTHHKMPFQFEWLMGDLYLAVFSHDAIAHPPKNNDIQSIEGVVGYLISLYSKPGNFVIAPMIGTHGEVLMACEKMERICFTGDQETDRLARAIVRWQQWTEKTATKVEVETVL
jgi:ParB family transcriptional regulator, chromosome partitioning protein